MSVIHSEELFDALLDEGVVLRAETVGEHWELASGSHSNVKADLSLLSPSSDLYRMLCEQMALLIQKSCAEDRFSKNPTLVVPVPSGANPYAQTIASILGIGYFDDVQVIRQEGKRTRFQVRGGPEALSGQRIWVQEDVVNKGGSISRLVVALGFSSGTTEIVGRGALLNRGQPPLAHDEGRNRTTTKALIEWPREEVPITEFDPGSCVLCQRGLPLAQRQAAAAS